MNMKGVKRKKTGSEPQNIKRWRSEITGYTGQSETEDRPQKKKNDQLSRKEKRKEGRQLKKMRKAAFRQHKTLPTHESLAEERNAKVKAFEKKKKRQEKRKRNRENRKAKLEAEREEDEAKQKAHEKESAEDDKMIKQLEKQMKINKRKSKTLPQSFQNDGLDFILNVVDAENMKGVLDEDDEKELAGPLLESGSEEESGEEDIGLGEEEMESELEDSETEHKVPEISGAASEDVKGILKKGDKSKSNEKTVQFGDTEHQEATTKSKEKPKKKSDILDFIRQSIDEVKSEKKKVKIPEEEMDDSDDDSESNDDSDLEDEDMEFAGSDEEDDDDGEDDDADDDNEVEEAEGQEEHLVSSRGKEKEKLNKKPQEHNEDNLESENEEDDVVDDSDDDDDIDDDFDDMEDESEEMPKPKKVKQKKEEFKEDIYGRLLDKDGNFVTAKKPGGAYVPPGKRLQMASSQDEKKKLEIERLKKQLKGLINRLSESNMQSISSQIEDMFRTRSRAELSESLTSIIMDACISPTLIPERLISEQMMLLAILQGNVGNEVGAVFLQSLAEQFNSRYEQIETQGKEVDNILIMIASMYNFKMFHSVLIFDILKKLTDSFKERDIELILVLLKNVGFTLRKDDPVTLKEIIVKVQEKAGSVDTSKFLDESRVKFMLEVLMAIRNNNMRKIPNYDPTHVDHLRKVLRNYTKGSTSSDTQLRISLEDLLSAGERGRWWLVGSAWSGRDASRDQIEAQTESTLTNIYSEKILELARQQRMNTDVRRNIFCIIMTSEDFADAFEKLLRLNLKNQQEREIINVIIDVSLQEKSPNPFYAYLAQKFCEFHRRFQMTVQFNFWDRLKILSELTPKNITNLSAFMTHLIATKAISISIFKVVEFSELDKHKLQLIRSILHALLLDQPDHIVSEVFGRVAGLPKLAALREALRVFMRHFLLRRAKKDSEREALQERVDLAERALGSSEGDMSL